MTDETVRLSKELIHPDPQRRIAAAEGLMLLGEAARPAAVALVRATGDAAEEVREAAAGTLEELGPPDLSDRDALAALLTDARPDVAYWAATLLGRLGCDAAHTVPALAQALTSCGVASVRQRAAWALGQIGPEASRALEPLREATGSDDPRLSRLAQTAIERITIARDA